MVTHKNSGMNLKFKTKKDSQYRVVLGLLFYEMCILCWWFCSKKGQGLVPISFLQQFNLDHHNFVILSGLKAFRLQETGSRVYALHTHTHWGDAFSVAARDGLIMSPNLSLIPPVSDTPEEGNDRRCSSVRLQFQFHNTHNAVLNTRAPTRAHHGEMCVNL